MILLILETDQDSITTTGALSEAAKILQQEGVTILDATNIILSGHNQLIELSTQVDGIIFEFYTTDNMINSTQQSCLVVLTRALYEFKVPVMVSMIQSIHAPLAILISMLHAKNDTVYRRDTTSELLDEIRKRFKISSPL